MSDFILRNHDMHNIYINKNYTTTPCCEGKAIRQDNYFFCTTCKMIFNIGHFVRHLRETEDEYSVKLIKKFKYNKTIYLGNPFFFSLDKIKNIEIFEWSS